MQPGVLECYIIVPGVHNEYKMKVSLLHHYAPEIFTVQYNEYITLLYHSLLQIALYINMNRHTIQCVSFYVNA